MRLVYLCLILLGIGPTLCAQELVPLTRNTAITTDHIPIPDKSIGLRNSAPECNDLFTPGVVYLDPSGIYSTLLNVDTTGLDTIPGTFSCINCDALASGQATIENDRLTYTANPDVEAGKDTFSVEFCNPNGCRTLSFSIIVRRPGQAFTVASSTLNPGESQRWFIPEDGFPGPVVCYQVVDCEDTYGGDAATLEISREGDPAALQLFYKASSFGGIDSICVQVCDSFAICDTFKFAVQILQDTIGLPFMDDFSYDGPFPSSDLWLDENTFINNTMAIDPPSVGVATFDGLNANGIPYGGDYGVSDIMTSTYIDLSVHQTEEVFLIYWLQRKGLVDKPEPQDSMVLEFKTREGVWQYIEGFPGIPVSQPNTINDPFLFFRQPVTNEFKYDGFQFRFKNYSNRTGILDTWHLDYVRLDVIQVDSTFDDIAFTTPPRSILNNHRSMPFRHFKGRESIELRDTLQVGIFNLSRQGLTASPSVVTLTELNSNTELFGPGGVTLFNGDEANLPSGEPVRKAYALNSFPTDFSAVWPDYFQIMSGPAFDNFERLEFEMTYEFSNTTQAEGVGYEAVSENDRVTTTTIFDNYFAYDDGTAEAGFIAQNGNSVAVKFTTAVDDSLRAIQFHFPHTSIDVSEQFFDLRIWLDTPNSDPVYEQLDLRPFYTDLFFDTLQGFTTYTLINTIFENEPLFLPAGDFYVGWTQNTPCDGTQCIAVGYDKNSPNGKQFIWLNQGGDFNPLDSSLLSFPSGALMIRPVLGSTTPMATVSTEEAILSTDLITVYPNPAQDFLQVQIQNNDFRMERFEIFNNLGQQVKTGHLLGAIPTDDLAPGWYLLKGYENHSQRIAIAKFIISR